MEGRYIGSSYFSEKPQNRFINSKILQGLITVIEFRHIVPQIFRFARRFWNKST